MGTHNKVQAALDQVEALLQRAGGKEEPDSEWDVDTMRHEVEQLQAADVRVSQEIAALKARPPMPTPVQVIVNKPDSDPPSTRGVAVTWKKGVRLGQMPPWAVVVMVLGLGAMAGAVWVLTH